MSDEAILAGIMRVAEYNASLIVKDPNVDNPRCKPALGSYICERCGHDVRGAIGACPSIPAGQRWRVEYDA